MKRRAITIALSLLVTACVGVHDDPCAQPGQCTPWGLGDGADDEGDETDDGDDEGQDDGQDESDGGGPPSGDGPDDGGAPDGDGLPCAVRDALAANCGMCHGESPAFGAPMPLTNYDDLQVPAPSDATRSVYELVADRMTANAGRMPPDGDISDADAATILDWISDGAPEDPEAACGGDPPADGDADDVGPDALPCDPTHVLTAHADGSEQPFVVPTQGAEDLYMCFAFQSPFAEGMQATAWAPVIDDERVVHHWILYRASGGNYTDGSVFPCDLSLQVSADFVAGWAPGGGNVELPSDVGLELGAGDTYVLQVHYNNAAHHPDAIDRSGVAFCTTPAPRPNTAGVLTLGTTSIDIPAGAVAHEESGTCGWLSTIFWPELHIIASSPHMHGLGRGFRTVLERGDGSTELVTDVPVFDFASQGMYMNEPEIVVQPGDRLHSTCVFDNPGSQPVGFGEGTGDEMCFNFVLAYPIDQLANRNCGIIF